MDSSASTSSRSRATSFIGGEFTNARVGATIDVISPSDGQVFATTLPREVEFTGVASGFLEGLHLARQGGRYLVVGQLGDAKAESPPALIVTKNLTVIGSFSGDARSYSMVLVFISAHMADFPFEKMITGCYRLDDVHFPERMNNLQQIKPVILV